MKDSSKYYVKIKSGETAPHSVYGTTITLCNNETGEEVLVPGVRNIHIFMEIDEAVIAKIELVNYPGDLEITAVPEFIFAKAKDRI